MAIDKTRPGPAPSDAPTSKMLSLLVCYDIADDRRREDLAEVLVGLGPRVQLSTFECQVRGAAGLRTLRRQIQDIIEVAEDQVRIYVLGTTVKHPIIEGNRILEEWRDFILL